MPKPQQSFPLALKPGPERWWQPLLPSQVCRLCHGASRELLCKHCLRQVVHPVGQNPGARRCPRCALWLPTDEHVNANCCGECLAKPPPFERTLTACDYLPPVSDWLQGFKYRGDLRDGCLLSQLLFLQLRQHYRSHKWPRWLIPVPLHWSKLIQRGFNQSHWICRQLQRQHPFEVLRCLQRQRGGHSQKELDRNLRLASLRGLFEIRHNAHRQLQGQRVALVDDVVTTTATVRTLARVLLDNGCASVEVWCLARTGKCV